MSQCKWILFPTYHLWQMVDNHFLQDGVDYRYSWDLSLDKRDLASWGVVFLGYASDSDLENGLGNLSFRKNTQYYQLWNLSYVKILYTIKGQHWPLTLWKKICPNQLCLFWPQPHRKHPYKRIGPPRLGGLSLVYSD
jgi:hypothetical protein